MQLASLAARRRIRRVRRQFEALRPRRQILHAQPDGEELDLSAVVRALADRRAGAPGSDRLYSAARTNQRDLAVAVLVSLTAATAPSSRPRPEDRPVGTTLRPRRAGYALALAPVGAAGVVAHVMVGFLA